MLYWCLSNVLEALELAAEARAGFEKTVELDPQFGLGWWSLGLHDAVCKRPAEARAAAEKGFAIHPELPYNIGLLLAGVLGNAGETTQSEALLERLPTGTAGASVARSCFHLVEGVSPTPPCNVLERHWTRVICWRLACSSSHLRGCSGSHRDGGL